MAKSKSKTIYECTACGSRFPKWVGRCTECGGWSSVEEFREAPLSPAAQRWIPGEEGSGPTPLTEVDVDERERVSSTMEELDRVLGGGVVAGSAVLVGGDPGIGKSTLLLQLLLGLGQEGRTTLYVSGEESSRQLRMRAERIGGASEKIKVLTEIDVERIISVLEKENPAAAVMDSVQTLVSPEIQGAPGTVSQVREVAARLVGWAKGRGIPLFLVGHVTKDGALAGPRVLEHMVDTVLYFEGDKGHPYRILRAVKNRFGSTNEVGVFEMGARGLIGVKNPSELFLAERPEGASGSVVLPSLEGSRVILVEVQTLTAPQNYGSPQRTVSGVERNRVQILAALLDRRLGLALANHDIFVSVAGGMQVNEPAGDLALVAALISAYMDRPVDGKTVFFGEVGLAGEVRGVSRPLDRLKEAKKLGYDRAVLPVRQAREVSGVKEIAGMELVGVESIDKLVDSMGG
ncbi:MAG: DNA repair protein RadA [Deltaproteobacteria bacterium]|nr:MAG: DNA repair protein RadA [Deltaproteobacteria bacterium]